MNCLEVVRADKQTGYSISIRNAIDYMRHNYSHSDLTIDIIANQVGFSSGRLSVLFKQEVGQTVNKFLTDIRIEMAISLLENSQCKIYEIAEMVGYKSSQYFSQIFCRSTGRRPIDYRKIPD